MTLSNTHSHTSQICSNTQKNTCQCTQTHNHRCYVLLRGLIQVHPDNINMLAAFQHTHSESTAILTMVCLMLCGKHGSILTHNNTLLCVCLCTLLFSGTQVSNGATVCCLQLVWSLVFVRVLPLKKRADLTV